MPIWKKRLREHLMALCITTDKTAAPVLVSLFKENITKKWWRNLRNGPIMSNLALVYIQNQKWDRLFRKDNWNGCSAILKKAKRKVQGLLPEAKKLLIKAISYNQLFSLM